VDYRIVVMGPENRERVVFNEFPEAPTGSSVLSTWKGKGVQEVVRRMQTLDTVLAEAGMAGVDLIKLDVQGYELEVLKGAAKSLKTMQAVLMEVSLIEMYQGNPLLHDVVAFMQQQDFVTYDICSLMRRPLDSALAQVDMIFVPRSSPLVRSKEYAVGTII
jgi:hypothetical protein